MCTCFGRRLDSKNLSAERSYRRVGDSYAGTDIPTPHFMPSRNCQSSYHDESLSESTDTSALLPISPCPSAGSTHRQSRTDSRRPHRATCPDGQRKPL